MKNQTFSRYHMQMELSYECSSEWELWRAWVEPLWIHVVGVLSNFMDECVNVWIYIECLCTVYYLNVFWPLLVLLRLCFSRVQITRCLTSNLRLRMMLCLFSCLSFGSIVWVTLICNTRGLGCPIFFYVSYLFVLIFILRWTAFSN